jgi:hypothetical protein
MYLFEVGLAVAAVVGLVLSIAAYFLLAAALWPRLVGAVEARFTRAPLVSVVTGLPLAVLAFVVSTKLHAFGLVAGAVVLGLALAGGAGVAARVGRALGHEGPAAVLRGGLVLLFASLIPLLGWFLVLPALIAGGLGALVLTVVRPLRAAPSVPEAA